MNRNRREKVRVTDMRRMVDKVCGVTVEELEEQLRITVQAISDSSCGYRIQPTWPWVLIRVVPKEQKLGHLYLPDTGFGSKGQNKPLWEGIVLETWKPHWSRKRQPGEEYKNGTEIWRESEFKRGDRVLFPHFAGLPAEPFRDDKNYRLIREWTFDPSGGAMCIVHYNGDCDYKKKLDELFEGLISVTTSGA